MTSIPSALHLIPHPDTPPVAVTGIRVTLSADRLRFEVDGADALRLPEPERPKRTDELWRTTCFEMFVKPDGGDAYLEFNFSPSTQWAAYAFDGYRGGMRNLPLKAAPVITRSGDAWTIALPVDDLPAGARRIALTAVIEEVDGTISYWALAHPGEKPDFHHPGGFVLDLPG